jgi:hypothetical protein
VPFDALWCYPLTGVIGGWQPLEDVGRFGSVLESAQSRFDVSVENPANHRIEERT